MHRGMIGHAIQREQRLAASVKAQIRALAGR
jgi:hypothetical protein